MKKYVVYEHISPSGKVYVGQTCELQTRWEGKGHRYFGKNKKGQYVQPYFANALLKYGWDNFEHKIILEGISKSEANYAEKYLIRWYKMHNMSYNCTDGGEGTCGIKRTMSPEMCAYMSEYMRANSPLKGTHRTEKQKQSAREKMLGRKNSLEARAKMSKTHKGLKSPWLFKKVYAFDKRTGEFVRDYESISAAAKDIGVNPSAVGNAARGKAPSAGPYVWSYTSVVDISDPRFSKMQYSEVYCYSKVGDLIAIFPSVTMAASAIEGNRHSLGNCLCGNTPYYKGYIWRGSLQDKEVLLQEVEEIRNKKKAA